MKKLVSILLILVLIFSLSCVAFAADDVEVISPEHGNTDPDTDNPDPSPKTGDTGLIYWVIAAAVLALGAAVFCGRKLIVNK